MLGDLEVLLLGKASGNAMDARPKFLRHLGKFHRMTGRDHSFGQMRDPVWLHVDVVRHRFELCGKLHATLRFIIFTFDIEEFQVVDRRKDATIDHLAHYGLFVDHFAIGRLINLFDAARKVDDVEPSALRYLCIDRQPSLATACIKLFSSCGVDLDDVATPSFHVIWRTRMLDKIR